MNRLLIGLIMLVAVFPVGILQSRTVVSDTEIDVVRLFPEIHIIDSPKYEYPPASPPDCVVLILRNEVVATNPTRNFCIRGDRNAGFMIDGAIRLSKIAIWGKLVRSGFYTRLNQHNVIGWRLATISKNKFHSRTLANFPFDLFAWQYGKIGALLPLIGGGLRLESVPQGVVSDIEITGAKTSSEGQHDRREAKNAGPNGYSALIAFAIWLFGIAVGLAGLWQFLHRERTVLFIVALAVAGVSGWVGAMFF